MAHHSNGLIEVLSDNKDLSIIETLKKLEDANKMVSDLQQLLVVVYDGIKLYTDHLDKLVEAIKANTVANDK